MGKGLRDKTCCFTGHRKLSLLEQKRITQSLPGTLTDLIHAGIRYFGTGGALGFDTLAAQAVLQLRNDFPHIKLILVLPCRSQAKGWREDDVQAYNSIKQAADKIVFTSEEYTRDCMHKRNRHLVDHSGTCVCYLTRNRGGTAYTVNYAKEKGLEIINLAENIGALTKA